MQSLKLEHAKFNSFGPGQPLVHVCVAALCIIIDKCCASRIAGPNNTQLTLRKMYVVTGITLGGNELALRRSCNGRLPVPCDIIVSTNRASPDQWPRFT